MSSLLEFTERGIYCQKAGVFIDPWKGVPRALITHAHSDHARPGCQHYLCTHSTAPLIKHRLGGHQNIQSVQFNESIDIHGVKFSFHPAGHIYGSAQIRVEDHGEIWVVSGDYKLAPDGVSEPFEPIRCHTFISESTFGLPIYQWPDPHKVISEINTWWMSNSRQGITSVISAYALGKAQRILQNVDHSIGPVYCHQSVEMINTVLRNAAVPLKPTSILDDRVTRAELQKALLIIPGASINEQIKQTIGEYSTASASGWMMLRGRKNWQNVDRGFILSDHADWRELNATIDATECDKVVVTHGYSEIMAKWLREKGYEALAEKTTYDEGNETG